MERKQIRSVLKHLGFFYIQEEDQGTQLDFRAGHVPNAPFTVLSLHKTSGACTGPYAELVERLAPVLSRYVDERNEVSMLPPESRQAWIAALAREAQLTPSEFQTFTSN